MAVNLSLEGDSKQTQTVFSVAKDYVKSPIGVQQMVVRPVVRSLKWAEWFQGELSQTSRGCKTAFGNMNHTLEWFNYPGQLRSFGHSIVSLKDSMLVGSVAELPEKTQKVFINGVFSIDLIADALKIFHNEKWISLSISQLQVLSTIGFLGSIALFMTAMNGIKMQFSRIITSEIGRPDFKGALLKLIAKVCLLAVSAFGIAAHLYGTIVMQWLSLSVSTGLLLFSLTAYFYEEMHVVNNKKTVAT
ncbi:MAG: hypothetical protein K1000chlam2_01363 [Chlamydiae bacterium]|nr:hypothetical protein [Chlamydiota bacterium]